MANLWKKESLYLSNEAAARKVIFSFPFAPEPAGYQPGFRSFCLRFI